jgi:hypothetical protein
MFCYNILLLIVVDTYLCIQQVNYDSLKGYKSTIDSHSLVFTCLANWTKKKRFFVIVFFFPSLFVACRYVSIYLPTYV